MSNNSDTPPPLPPSPETLVPINIEDEMRASYLDYAMSVIIGRALPDVRDGLKPVHRRVLFAMQDLGNAYNRAYKKSARVVGDVIGKYHPHGDSAVYDSLVRLAQDFSMRHLLVDGQGNFGSVDGDRAAAMRYTEVRMAKLASEMLADIDKDTVDFGPNYDESLQEPLVLPTRFPNLLINGSSGIAVGMATNIPPHNLAEVLDAAIALMRTPHLTTHELMRHMPGPDFPTGGVVYGTQGLRQAYETGRGTIQVRGRALVEAGKRNERLVITEIPYQLNKTSLIEKIADLVRNKRLEGISDIRDESDRDGMRVVIELKRDAHADVVLNQLYRLTPLQSSFGYNMLAIVAGQPRVLSLRDLLGHFLNHRRDVVTRRCRFELREAQKRFNLVFGLLAAIDAIDRIIALIRSAQDQAQARNELMHEPLVLSASFRTLCESLLTFHYPQGRKALGDNILHLDAAQAQAILDMRLARLTGLERDKLTSEAKELQQTIERLTAILASQALLTDVIVEELHAVKKEYANKRRTDLVQDARMINVEDLIANEPMVVTISHAGYVKRNPISLYQAQRRGGRGKTAATTRDEDFVETIFVASTHAYVLVFTDPGQVYWLKVHEIPQGGRTSRGKPIVNLIAIEPGERVAAVLPVTSFVKGEYVMMCTAQGIVKKTDLMAFANPRPSGLKALVLDPGDKLINVGITDGERDILLATRHGLCVRFSEDYIRPLSRKTRGVRGVTFKVDGDSVVGMVIVDSGRPQLLTVCDNGYGVRSNIVDYTAHNRGGKGLINIQVDGRNGLVAGVSGVDNDAEVMIVTNRGMMIRFAVNQVSVRNRGSRGVRLIAMQREGELVASVARLAESAAQEETDGQTDGAAPVQPEILANPVVAAEDADLADDGAPDTES
jgi:DNA gyrase subunit A